MEYQADDELENGVTRGKSCSYAGHMQVKGIKKRATHDVSFVRPLGSEKSASVFYRGAISIWVRR
jgi:hypothetical protein